MPLPWQRHRTDGGLMDSTANRSFAALTDDELDRCVRNEDSGVRRELALDRAPERHRQAGEPTHHVRQQLEFQARNRARHYRAPAGG